MNSGNWTVLRALTWTLEAFRAADISSPRLDAELLLGHATGLERIHLYTQHDRPLAVEEREVFRALVKRRLAGEPCQYLIGRQEFWSLPFKVTPAVLIPRADTEVVVEAALAMLRESPDLEEPVVVDVGTGSGAIAVAIASEFPGVRVVACDVSAEALEVARENIALNEVEVLLIQGGLKEVVSKMSAPPNLIVSNPPYIRSEAIEGLQVEIRDYEPRIALDGGGDGLAVYREILPVAAEALAPGGGLVLEIGEGLQAEDVVSLLADDDGWGERKIGDDYSGKPRVVVARRAA